MRIDRLAPLVCALLLTATSYVHAVDYVELELSDLESMQAEFPAWLLEVTEAGGEFLPEVGWHVNASRPFGSGQLFLTLDRELMDQDLALTFTSPNTANIAVQLYDDAERIVAVDLLAERLRSGAAKDVTTVVVPLTSFPTAKHIVLRRLDGPVEMPYLALLPLTYPVAQSAPQLRDLAARFGEPSSLENPYVGRIQAELGAGVDVWQQVAEPLQPLYALAKRGQGDALDESELLAVLQVLGLQGFDFNAFDFVRAAGEGREEVVSLYLRAGMPIDVQGDNKYTAAAEAATSGELRVLRLLCEQGADLEIRTAGGNTVLWMACISSNFEAIRLLVEAGADVNARCVRGETPLNILIQWRNQHKQETLAAMKYLLENGVDLEISDNLGRTAIHVAIEEGWTEEVRAVLRYHPNLEVRNKRGHTPMMVVQYRNNSAMKRDLLAAGAEPWEPTFESLDDELVYLIHRRQYRDALKLVEAGANPNVNDLEGSPIAFRIVRHQNIDYLKSFMALGLSLDARDRKNQILLDAQSGGFSEKKEAMFAFLLDQGLDPNYATDEDLRRKKPYWTPLMKAADSGNIFRCRRLLAAGADPTVKNLPRRTAAIIAERNGHIQLASELKEAEAKWLAAQIVPN